MEDDTNKRDENTSEPHASHGSASTCAISTPGSVAETVAIYETRQKQAVSNPALLNSELNGTIDAAHAFTLSESDHNADTNKSPKRYHYRALDAFFEAYEKEHGPVVMDPELVREFDAAMNH